MTTDAPPEAFLVMDSKFPEVDKSTVEGRYADYLEVGHNAFEFFFDFGQGQDRVKVYTRIATNPFVAQQLSELLQEALEKYYRKYDIVPGTIAPPDTEWEKS
jgi:hypothetical protein